MSLERKNKMSDNININELYNLCKRVEKYQQALTEIANEDFDYIRKQPYELREIAREVLINKHGK